MRHELELAGSTFPRLLFFCDICDVIQQQTRGKGKTRLAERMDESRHRERALHWLDSRRFALSNISASLMIKAGFLFAKSMRIYSHSADTTGYLRSENSELSDT